MTDLETYVKTRLNEQIDAELGARRHLAQRLDQRTRVTDLEARGQHDRVGVLRLEQIDRVVAARADEHLEPALRQWLGQDLDDLGDAPGVGDHQDARL